MGLLPINTKKAALCVPALVLWFDMQDLGALDCLAGSHTMCASLDAHWEAPVSVALRFAQFCLMSAQASSLEMGTQNWVW